MSSTLNVTTELLVDHYLITAEVVPGGTLPQEIFLYLNTGTSTLGDYYGICNVDELTRIQTWTGSSIPLFGNKFVKYGQAKIKVDLQANINSIIAQLVKLVKALSLEYQASASESHSFLIP